MNTSTNLIIQNNDTRIKQKNLTSLQHLIKFKKYRRKCKDCLNEINEIISKDHIKNISLDDINSKIPYDKDINNLIIYSNKLKLNILHMTYYYNKISTYN